MNRPPHVDLVAQPPVLVMRPHPNPAAAFSLWLTRTMLRTALQRELALRAPQQAKEAASTR
jgi:hypothetical protein